ncbi:OmpA family protein [bacterium]|nr:OmpA family protein [bacterium]
MAPSFLDTDPRQLEAGLARSRQETQVMQDEIAVLREQLASTSTQLAQARAAGVPASQPAAPASPPGTMTPVAMHSAMAALSLPGVEKRLDGGVVRLEIPADKLFEPGGVNLLPAGSALLTQVADELERVYPGHFLGIEGHTDTEPLQNASWGSQHQLSVARASTVFDFLTSRTSLKQGQLFLVAHGPNHPVVSNATAAGRARNRRIEIVVYPERSGADATLSSHPAAAAAGGG